MRYSRASRAAVALCFGTAWLFPAACAREAQELELGPGVAIEQTLAADEVHAYRLAPAGNRFLHLIVEQRGIDVVLRLVGPDDRLPLDFDSPNGQIGLEPVSITTEAPASFRLEIRAPKKTEPGSYRLTVGEAREVTPRDRRRVAAEWVFARGEGLRRQGEWDAAIGIYQEALQIWTELGEDARAGDAHERLGRANQKTGEPEAARRHLEEAWGRFRVAGEGRREVRLLDRLGRFYRLSGEVDEAFAVRRRALDVAREIEDRKWEAISLQNLALIYRQLGEIREAFRYYRQAISLVRELGNRPQEARVLHNLGEAHLSQGQLERAITLFDDALELWRELGDRPGEARTLNSLGTAYQRSGQLQSALDDYLLKALEIRQELGDRRAEAVTFHDIGNVYYKLNELELALHNTQLALKIFHELGDLRSETTARNSLGRLYGDLEHFDLALKHHNEALRVARELRDRSNEATALYGIARTEGRQGRLDEALARVEDSLAVVESLRIESDDQGLRSSYFASKLDYYELNINLLMDLHRREPWAGFDARALHAAERSRARSFLEALIEAHAEIRTGVDDELLGRERSVHRQLNAMEQRRLRTAGPQGDDKDFAVIDRRIGDLLAQLHSIQVEIRLASPHYAELTQPRLLRLAEIQRQILDEETLLLIYSLGERRSFLFAVTPNSLRSYELPARQQIEVQARKTYALLSRSPGPGTDVASRRATAALSDMILAPAAAQLGFRRLLVISDGALQYLPLAALPDPSGQEPLIVDHEIIHLPSASSLAALEGRLAGRAEAPKTLAIVADPVFGCDDPRVLQKCPDPEPNGYPRLPHARPWAEDISSLVPAEDRLLLLGFDANLEAVNGGKLGQYRIVHFYTHGELDSQHPELSRIVLSLVDESGQSRDGFLHAFKAYNLGLSADLVVLSACKTALGREVRGEGLVGLTRGFMYAGAARVVVSLWSVRDGATAELMRRFYGFLLEDRLEPAAALREAQLSMLRETLWGSPFHWAAFEIQGIWR